MSWKLWPSSRGTVSRSSAGARLLPDMPDRLVDQPRRLDRIGAVAVEDRQPGKLARLAAMSLPGVWYSDGTEMP